MQEDGKLGAGGPPWEMINKLGHWALPLPVAQFQGKAIVLPAVLSLKSLNQMPYTVYKQGPGLHLNWQECHLAKANKYSECPDGMTEI